MTNTPYGNQQTPSSRPPEPPYRTGSQYANEVNTTPIDRVPAIDDATSIQADTSGYDVPGTGYGSYGPSDAATEPQAQVGTQQKATENYVIVDSTQPMPRAEAPYEGAHATAQQATTAYRTADKPAQKKQGGAGKTFLFGFLGAALACVLALGGYTLIGGGANTQASTDASPTTSTIGTTDSSVINAVEEGQTLAEAVAAKALPSVVAVYNYQAQASSYGYGYGFGTGGGDLTAAGMGSGVVLSDDGYIITNYHVVEGADKLTVTVDGEERDATYVGGDSSSDVAVVKVENTEGLVPADLGDSDNLVIGEWVMTVGAPLGLEQSVATGVVSATNRSTIMSNSDDYSSYYQNTTPEYTYYPNMIQTDAVINPGNSGGALVDADGKLIGINTMISSYSGDYAGVGFAIPVNYAIGIAEQVIDGKNPTHAILGVTISQVNANIAKRYNLPVDEGAYISTISEGTGAADSDLRVGDIITKVDDTKVTSTTDVTLEVRAHNPGDTVTVTVNRDGQTKDIEVVLSSDENLTNSNDDSEEQNGNGQGNDYGYGQGNGYGYGQGNGNGYGYGNGGNSQNLEDLLRMLGM